MALGGTVGVFFEGGIVGVSGDGFTFQPLEVLIKSIVTFGFDCILYFWLVKC